MAAVVVLTLSGATINTMVLAGLVIALGEVVDDAIIDVENIVRRLRLARATGSTESPFQIVLAASLEVRSAVVYASLIVMLVFVPVFFLDGIAGSFFRPLALAYILAILASLLVALIVTPGAVADPVDRASESSFRAADFTRAAADVRCVIAEVCRPSGDERHRATRGVSVGGSRDDSLGARFLPEFKRPIF